jgi:DNA-binding NarL/FixJ family response regulator
MDIEAKNKELAASAMKVIYKNEKMLEVKTLIEALSHENSENYSKKISSILQFIEKELKEDQWDDFELRFDQANNNFIKRLKSSYPELSSWDLKVCAYLKMNLSTKEIAQILNMSVRGVETARFRIRKRIGLEQAESMSDFILKF